MLHLISFTAVDRLRRLSHSPFDIFPNPQFFDQHRSTGIEELSDDYEAGRVQRQGFLQNH